MLAVPPCIEGEKARVTVAVLDTGEGVALLQNGFFAIDF